MGLPLPIPGGGKGGGIGLILIVAVLFLLFGRGMLSGEGGGISPIDPFPAAPGAQGSTGAPDETLEFVKFVSKDTQDFWAAQFDGAGKAYDRATVVVFSSATSTGCGAASSSTGPFYCPLDQQVYLDLGFFDVLARRLGAGGDFAQAYVIAHEVSHHVQNLLGTEPAVRREREADPSRANDLSVRLELQADCYAGVWGHSTYERGLLEPGDIEEGIGAAAAVGDDRLGAGSPENWTHGSSALRVKWFRKGFDSGDANACDTFSGSV
jgi:predicted metalloprotease